MLIVPPTILNWDDYISRPRSKTKVCLRRSKCSVDRDNFGPNTNDITTRTFEPHAEPRRTEYRQQASGKHFARF